VWYCAAEVPAFTRLKKRGSQVQGQPKLHSNGLSQKKKIKNIINQMDITDNSEY
jgi:hypothetical protein